MISFQRNFLPALFAVLIAALSPLPALAVMPDEVLSDPVLESRARALSQELRCLVCQNQSIDDSNAPLARDLRLVVRERLSLGDSDDEVLAFIANRFGSYALLKPPYAASTALLWVGPFLVLLAGGAVMLAFTRRSSTTPQPAPPLSEDEQQRLAALYGENV